MSGTPAESNTRSRTRRAILRAASATLARDRKATLSDIAAAAQVGRSTLHRYFPDREELVRAAVVDSLTALGQSMQGAAIDQGAPLEAMRRLIAAMVDAGDHIAFLFGDPGMSETLRDSRWEPETTAPTVLDLIRRGQDEGVFDRQVTPEWIQHVLWALTYTGWEAAEKGELPRHGVTAAVLRAFENGAVVQDGP